MTPERRKVVLLCAAVACMSSGPIFLRNHPVLVALWLAVMVSVLVYVGTLFSKLKKHPR